MITGGDGDTLRTRLLSAAMLGKLKYA